MKNEEINKHPVQLISDKVSIDCDVFYKVSIDCDVFLALVEKNSYVLRDVDKEWVEENPEQYKEIVEEAVTKDGYTLEYVNEAWVAANPQWYKEIALKAVTKDGYTVTYVNEKWVAANPQWYKEIALKAVKDIEFALRCVNKDWASKNFELYKEIALEAVNRKEFAFKYADAIFRNNIKIIISLLINLDRKYSKESVSNIYNNIEDMFSSPCEPAQNILLYLYMLNNKNVSNNFKNALFNFFIEAFNYTPSSLDKFKLYKNILECYLTSSDNYNKNFPKHQLLKDLSEDDSQQLHMFLSLADHSLMENSEFAKLLKNDPNDTIKNYLKQKDTHNLKSIKDFNIYSSLLPKNLFVINYDKIINKMKNTPLNDNLIKLILCYSRIEDLLVLSEALNLGDKLEVKYLDIDPKFQREDGHITIGIEAWVNAIKNDGFLRNTGKYKYDSLSPIYNSLDIELSQDNELIEYNL